MPTYLNLLTSLLVPSGFTDLLIEYPLLQAKKRYREGEQNDILVDILMGLLDRGGLFVLCGEESESNCEILTIPSILSIPYGAAGFLLSRLPCLFAGRSVVRSSFETLDTINAVYPFIALMLVALPDECAGVRSFGVKSSHLGSELSLNETCPPHLGIWRGRDISMAKLSAQQSRTKNLSKKPSMVPHAAKGMYAPQLRVELRTS